MNTFVGMIVAVILLLFAYLMVRVIKRVEIHGKVTPDIRKNDRTFIHGIISIFLYPLMFVSIVTGILIIIPLLFLFHPKKILPIVRVIARIILFFSGFWLTVRGKEQMAHPRPFILMFNHQSLHDVFILGAIFYRYMVGLGASYQFQLPIWGTVVRRWGNIPIQRKNLQSAIQSIELAKKKLKEGTSILMAPEGTRTLDGKLLPFKKGPFHLALGAKADILPMAIKGAFEIKRKTDWRIKPGVVTVRFGEIIPYEQYQKMTVEELRDYIKSRIQSLMNGIQ